MSRGYARTALKTRLEGIAEHWQLPYKEAVDDALRKPAVVEEYVPVENQESSMAPLIFVSIGKVTQTGSVRSGKVIIGALTYASDSEQVYRDSENLIEDIETQLIANPWLGNGCKLIEPWETELVEIAFPLAQSILRCGIEMPAVEIRFTPTGEPLEV